MENKTIEILLVEDNMTDAEMTIGALRKNNLANKFLHLKDGAEALDFLFARNNYSSRKLFARNYYAEHKIEDGLKLIILALEMQKGDGLEVLRQIKTDERTKKIPVMGLISSKDYPDIDICNALGINTYVMKPVEFEKLRKAISTSGFIVDDNKPASRINKLSDETIFNLTLK